MKQTDWLLCLAKNCDWLKFKIQKFKTTWIERCRHLCVCPLIDHRREPIRMRELLGLLYKRCIDNGIEHYSHGRHACLVWTKKKITLGTDVLLCFLSYTKIEKLPARGTFKNQTLVAFLLFTLIAINLQDVLKRTKNGWRVIFIITWDLGCIWVGN